MRHRRACKEVLVHSAGGAVEPYEFQEEAWGEIATRLADGGGALLVEAPTASGKTEAATAPYFAQWLSEEWFLAPGLVYVLPTRALVEAQSERFRQLTRSMDKNLVIRAEQGSLIPSRHYLFGDVVVSTIDAFIYGLVAKRVPGGHTNPRLDFPAGNIATAFVVFDEVHMYQDEELYMPRVVNRVFRCLEGAQVPFVVMTATLPTEIEEVLFEGVEVRRVEQPAVDRGSVEVEVREKSIFDYLKTEGFEALLSAKRALIVCNTVERAHRVFRIVVAELRRLGGLDFDIIHLLHSRLKREDRRGREREVAALRYEKKRALVVTTQVLEAGLDASFDLVITEACPLDALLQRLGRCARRSHEEGKAVVVRPEGNAPYHEKILSESWDVVCGEHERISLALRHLERAKSLLDEVYTRALVEDLISSARSSRYLFESELYLARLRLFDMPPEHEFRLRPEMYATLVVTDRAVPVIDELLRSRMLNLGERAPEEREEVFKQLEELTFNVPVGAVERLFEQGALLREGDSALALTVRRGQIVVEPTRIERGRLRTYLLDPDRYEEFDQEPLMQYPVGLVELGGTRSG